MSVLDEQPTWVYRFFCEHGTDLYVGIAVDVDRRIMQHRATKSWWPEVHEISARLFADRRQALEVEALILRTKSPKYNVAGQPPAPTLPHRVLLCREYSRATGTLEPHEWEPN